MDLITLLLLSTLICVFLIASLARRRRLPHGLKPLPGPKGYPVVGSVPDVPEKNSYIKFGEWGKEYGPIYQVNLAGHNHVWISSDAIARQLLSKKGAIYSDRPHIPALLDDNRTSAQYLPLSSKNDGWSRQRKFANAIMRESEKATFLRYPEIEAKRLLVELMENPGQYNHAMESFIARVTCRLAWGHSEASDELKQRARELLIGVSPTGALGNKLPFLMSLPDWLVPAKAWERRRAKTERRFFEIMQGCVESDMATKSAPQSWMRSYLEAREKWGFQYALEGAYAVGMHGIAGALTIAAPMQTFALAMCHYPQYLPMLQKEIDEVCGNRLPRAEDRPKMPFLRAVIRECFRWRPSVPTGIPHLLNQDDVYEGYHIPANSVIHPLEWSISRDPADFPDPETFNPLRWVEPGWPSYREPLTEYPTILNCTQFGYGRRTCQGQTVADEDLFIGIGSIAWLFNISKTHERGDGAAASRSEDGVLHNEKATISSEELNAGILTTDDSAAPSTDSTPQAMRHQCPEKTPTAENTPLKWLGKDLDPTLDFTTLFIAKPLPFRFNLSVRDSDRAERVRQLFEDGVEGGQYAKGREFWGENQGRTQPLGWGKV